MRKLITLCLFSLLFPVSNELLAQGSRRKIGLYFMPYGFNDVYRFNALDGEGGYDNDGFFGIGLTFSYSVNPLWDLEIGVDYSRHAVIYHAPYNPEDILATTQKQNFNIVSVPFGAKINFLNYFFVNGGLLVNIDISTTEFIEKQTGIGAFLGIGGKYDFDSGFSVYLNPYCRLHTLIPFMDIENQQRVWESGIRLGVTYQLGK